MFRFLVAPLLLISFLSSAQQVIKVHIDHGGLHCPHLGPKFEERFSDRNEIDSVNVDSRTSIGTLYLSDGITLTDEQITNIIVHEVGYPQPEIKAIIRDEE